MPDLDQSIRERAYQLWIAGGRPEGHADAYWLEAQRELFSFEPQLAAETSTRKKSAKKPKAAVAKPQRKAAAKPRRKTAD